MDSEVREDGTRTTRFSRGGFGPPDEEVDYDDYTWHDVKPVFHNAAVRVDPPRPGLGSSAPACGQRYPIRPVQPQRATGQGADPRGRPDRGGVRPGACLRGRVQRRGPGLSGAVCAAVARGRPRLAAVTYQAVPDPVSGDRPRADTPPRCSRAKSFVPCTCRTQSAQKRSCQDRGIWRDTRACL